MASLGASWAVFGASWRSRGPLAYLGEPLVASWGSLGGLLEASWGPLGASWGPLGALLGRSWEPSRRSWGHLGGDLSKKGGSPISAAPLECLESLLGPFLRPKSFQNLGKINVLCFLAFSLLEPSWAVLGASWASWGSLGSLLEASWAPLGASWGALGALLGRSWEPSGRSWGHLGGDRSKKRGSPISVAPLECLESPLGPPKRPKSFQNLGKINVCCFLAFSLLEPSWAILDSLGASWGSLGSLLEASWGPLGVSWGHLGASWGALGALLEASWETWRASWSHLGCGRSNEGGPTVVSPPRGPRSL